MTPAITIILVVIILAAVVLAIKIVKNAIKLALTIAVLAVILVAALTLYNNTASEPIPITNISTELKNMTGDINTTAVKDTAADAGEAIINYIKQKSKE